MHLRKTQTLLLFTLFYALFSNFVVNAAQVKTSDKSAEISKALAEEKYGGVTSVLVSKSKQIIFEYYKEGFNKDSMHNTRSVGKTVTAILAGIAIDQGFIESESVKAAAFFPELEPFKNPDKRKHQISLQHLLAMSGPLECSDWNSFSRGNEDRMYIVEDWSGFYFDLPIKALPSWEVSDDPKYPRPFSYCTAGAQLVGEIVQRATKQDIEVFSKKALFDPLNIAKIKWNRASTGRAHMGGGLELTSTGWLKMAQLLTTNGTFDGQKIVSSTWVNQMLTPQSQIEENMDYGYFVWLPEKSIADKKLKIAMLSGTGGNRIYSLPEHDTSIVITKNAFRDRQAHDTSDLLFDALLERLVVNQD